MAMGASIASANAVAACKKQAARDYAANVRSCEQSLREVSARLRQCKGDARTRYDRALAACDARARKGGEGQGDFLGDLPPRAPEAQSAAAAATTAAEMNGGRGALTNPS